MGVKVGEENDCPPQFGEMACNVGQQDRLKACQGIVSPFSSCLLFGTDLLRHFMLLPFAGASETEARGTTASRMLLAGGRPSANGTSSRCVTPSMLGGPGGCWARVE